MAPSLSGVQPQQSWPVVVVHGPPGAGKSRLTRDLSISTGLAYFDRDEIKDTIFDNVGYSDRDWSMAVGSASWEVLATLADRLIRARVAFIVESNISPGPFSERIRAAALETNMPVASLHVTASHEVLWDRFDRRRRDGGRHPGHTGFTDRSEFLAELSSRDWSPIDFGGPKLQIDTTSGWPDVEAIHHGLRTGASDRGRSSQ